MDLYLQFGYGMMGLCNDLFKLWGGGTAVLSPRDLSLDQLENFCPKLRKQGASYLLDPQMYMPDGDHNRLLQAEYWPRTPDYFSNAVELERVLSSILGLNGRLGTAAVILPGSVLAGDPVPWVRAQRLILEKAIALGLAPGDAIATVALSSDSVRAEAAIEEVADWIDECPANSIYLVCEHPNAGYLVTDPLWLTNYLDLVAHGRLAGKKVIVGYCSHQMIVCAAAGANAICSGTWMNVRSFPADKFYEADDGTPINRATWYYAPHLLSEFQIPFLDFASKAGVLEDLTTPKAFESSFSDALFAAPQPSLAQFKEPEAFRHYLCCLRAQSRSSAKSSFGETIGGLFQLLDSAEAGLGALRGKGVSGQGRDFRECFDVNRAALSQLNAQRGGILARAW